MSTKSLGGMYPYIWYPALLYARRLSLVREQRGRELPTARLTQIPAINSRTMLAVVIFLFVEVRQFLSCWSTEGVSIFAAVWFSVVFAALQYLVCVCVGSCGAAPNFRTPAF